MEDVKCSFIFEKIERRSDSSPNWQLLSHFPTAPHKVCTQMFTNFLFGQKY